MSTAVTVNANRFAIFNETQNDHTSEEANLYVMRPSTLLIGFGAVPSTYQRRKILGYWLHYWLGSTQKNIGLKAKAFPVAEQWNEVTVLDATKPQSSNIQLEDTDTVFPPVSDYVAKAFSPSYGSVWDSGTASRKAILDLRKKEVLDDILSYGIHTTVSCTSGWIAIVKTSASSDQKPYIQFMFDDTNAQLEFTSFSPIGGYVPKYESKTFSWATSVNGFCVANIQATNYSLQWRPIGGSTRTINCGTNTSYTIPANTFTDDDIEWRIQATDDASNVITSSWMQFSTEEATSTANALSPKNELLSGSEPVTFSWDHIISTGTAQTKADLQYSTDGTTFQTLATVTGANQTYQAPANFFASGQIYWKVRTYNTDNVAGTWSDVISFICIAPPSVPVISATQTPKPVITWQTTSQQGYEIIIENVATRETVIKKTEYGTETKYTVPKYLDDGSYLVKIRAQNKYGIWSDYGTAPITVQNTAGTAITIRVDNDDAAIISIETSGSYSDFVIYRDNIAIAKTDRTQYKDYFAIGRHEYFVRGIYRNSDFYTKSNVVDIKLEVNKTTIFDVNEKNMIDISNSTASLRDITTNFQHISKFYHASSADYPVAEITRYRDQTMSLKVGFMADEDTTELEELRNKIVCVKTVNSDLIVGTITNMAKTKNEFITTYTISVRKINFEEEIEL